MSDLLFKTHQTTTKLSSSKPKSSRCVGWLVDVDAARFEIEMNVPSLTWNNLNDSSSMEK